MIEPNPSLHDDAPIRVTSSRVLFADDEPVHRKAPSLARLDTGRLLLTFSMNEGSDSLEGAVVLTESEDEGATWSEPRVVYDAPGWTCLNLGGLVRFSDEMIRLIIGRVKIDRSLGGDEPFYDWFTTFMDSRDAGADVDGARGGAEALPAVDGGVRAEQPARPAGRALPAGGDRDDGQGRAVAFGGLHRRPERRLLDHYAGHHRPRPPSATTATRTWSGWTTGGSWRW